MEDNCFTILCWFLPYINMNLLWHCFNRHQFQFLFLKPGKAYLVTQMVKNLPAMQETWVRSLGWEDSLEEGMATHSSILAWKIPMDRGAWWATVHGVAKSLT